MQTKGVRKPPGAGRVGWGQPPSLAFLERQQQPGEKLQEPGWGQRGPQGQSRQHLPSGSCQWPENQGTEDPCGALPCAPVLAAQSGTDLQQTETTPGPGTAQPRNCSLRHRVSAKARGQSGYVVGQASPLPVAGVALGGLASSWKSRKQGPSSAVSLHITQDLSF